MMNNNIVLLIIDSLRLDYSENLKPVLRKHGFKQLGYAVTTAPWTVPAHASILTGLYPSEHGAHETKNKKVGEIEFKIRDNLINDLKKKNYRTYLFTANAFLTERFGFRDFDYTYFNSNVPDRIFLTSEELRTLTELTLTKNPLEVLTNLLKLRKLGLMVKGSAVFAYRKLSSIMGGWPKEKGISKIIEMVRKTEFEEPYFIFINVMELHEPYRSNDIRAEYMRQLKYLHKKLDELFGIMERKSILESSLVIVTSDHGQLLGENGRFGHGTHLCDELILVPFFIRIPEVCRQRLNKDHEGYICHVNLRKFLLAYADGLLDLGLLYSDPVFAESFGSFSSKVEYPELEIHRIAVYHKGCKGVYNAELDEFEEVSCGDEGLQKELKRLVKEFLQKSKKRRRKLEELTIKEKIYSLRRIGKIV